MEQDEDKRASFKARLFRLECDPDVEIWYQDECGVHGDPRPRQVWAKKGSRQQIHYKGTHIKDNVIGAVRPTDGKFVSLIMPFVDTQIFQIFLDEMQQYVSSKKAVMILDNASWHRTKRVRWGKFRPLYLPPYSPDYNPIERIWLNMKTSFFTAYTATKQSELTDKLEKALRFYMDNQVHCRFLCYR